MLTTGDALAAFAVQAVRPGIEGGDLKACPHRPAGQPDAASWRAAFWTEGRLFVAEPHATVGPVSATGFSMGRGPQAVMRRPDALQGGAPCPRNGPRGDERLKAA